ncbi:hypothetical protein AB0K04_19145 [Micromonospora coxensis]|uniref:hypothetical protein n=1 Tax=Micromonospora coxensis TaxID=356852 RepID=UPI0034221CF9
MAFRTWGRLLLTALGVSVLAGAGQLGIAYGFGIVRLTGAFTDGAVDRWPAQLAWVGWFAVSAAVVGAVVTGRLARRDGLPEQTSVQLAVSGAAALGATVVAPLCMQPARAAELSTVDPVFAVGICAVAGAVVGAAAASAVLLKPPVGWNVAMLAGAVWLIALISVAPELLSAGPLRTVRLGVLEPSWLDADAAQRLAMLLLPTVALLAGAATGALARWQGHAPLIGGAAGAAGPVLLAFAYLTAGPGDSADRYQLAPYYGAVIAVAAGALGSTAATLVRWPLVPARTEDDAITPTDILRPLPTEPATAGATTATTVDLAGGADAARPAPTGRPEGGTPAHWDWPVTPGAPAPSGTPEPAPAADGLPPVGPVPAWPVVPAAALAEAPIGTGTRWPDDDQASAPASDLASSPATSDGDNRERQVALGDVPAASVGELGEPRSALGDAPAASVGELGEPRIVSGEASAASLGELDEPRIAPAASVGDLPAHRVVPGDAQAPSLGSPGEPWAALGDAPAAVASGSVPPPDDTEPVAAATVRPRPATPEPEPVGPVAATDMAGAGRTPDTPSAAVTGIDSPAAEPVGSGPVVAPRPRPKRPRKTRATEADPAGVDRSPAAPTSVTPTGSTPATPSSSTATTPDGFSTTMGDAPSTPAGSAPITEPATPGRDTEATPGPTAPPGDHTPRAPQQPPGRTTAAPAGTTSDPTVSDDATTRVAGTGGPGVDGERPGTGVTGVPAVESAPRPRHRLPDLASAGDWEAFGVRTSSANGALPFPAPPQDAEAPKPVAFRWHAEDADTTATDDDRHTEASTGSPTDPEPSAPARPRRGLFRRGKGKGGTPAAEAAQEEPLAAQDEEFVDWVAGLSKPLADNEPERESGRRSLRSSGRHHRD